MDGQSQPELNTKNENLDSEVHGNLPEPLPIKAPKNHKKQIIIAGCVIIIILILIGTFWLMYDNKASAPTTKSTTKATVQSSSPTSKVEGLQLDSNKNYGDKYANGILPVGDNKYVSDAARAGYVFVCGGYSQNLKNDKGGAGSRGPWFINSNTSYDINKKLHVKGSIMWHAEFSNKISGSNRTIITNDLPNHNTGVFPISPNDPAYAYDRNPNSIKGQTLTYNLASSPTYGAPNCMGGEAGIMLTGVALFNGFDAGGRDAGAWEIQDSCSGHPQKEGEYHYHTLSSCIKDISVKTVVGFALDGFPITGPQVGENNILTTSDLDECHGLTSEVVLDGKKITTYHYVMTQDFPYSISCFRAQPIQPPHTESGAQSQQPPPQH
jgi:hypothetical protein